jgi:uncharacterized lipoprotein YmbA
MICRIAVAFILGGLLAGCITLDPVSDNTRYYVLPGPPGSTDDTADALRIGLHPLALPPYLDHREIVVQRSGSEIAYQDAHRWADGLGAALQRSLMQHLESHATVSEIVRFPWGRMQFDRELTVRITECQGRDDGTARLTASWELDPGGKRNRAIFTGTYPPGDIPALVEALGDLVAQLAAAIHADLSP